MTTEEMADKICASIDALAAAVRLLGTHLHEVKEETRLAKQVHALAEAVGHLAKHRPQ